MADVPEIFDDSDPGGQGVDIGAGTTFWLAKANGDMQELAGLIEIPFPEETADLIEVTHMKSPNRRKQYIHGWTDGGEANLTMLYVPGSITDVAIREALNSRQARNFRLVMPLPAGTTVTVTGKLLVRSYSPANPMEDKRMATMGVKFTGAFTQAEPV